MAIFQENPLLILESESKFPFLYLPNKAVLNCFSYGLPEKALIEWSFETLYPKGSVFVDIGAHVGTYGLYYAKNGCSQVYMFECQKETYRGLRGGILLNNLEDKITSYNVALSSPENIGQKTLHIVSYDGGGSTLNASAVKGQGIKELGNEIVNVATLDDYKIENIGLIKIDVEGSELDVIKGGLETLKKNHYPKILFEAWTQEWYVDKKKELFNYLETLGYKIIPINGYPHMWIAEMS